jgi:flagellar protein FliS
MEVTTHMHANRIGHYRKNDIATADRKRLLIICYDTLIANLKLARSNLLEKKYDAKAKNITKSNEIITVLMEALDFEKGGTIANNLEAIYNYMLRRILHADVNRDINALDEIIGIAEELRGAWKQIFYEKRQAKNDYRIPNALESEMVTRNANSFA